MITIIPAALALVRTKEVIMCDRPSRAWHQASIPEMLPVSLTQLLLGPLPNSPTSAKNHSLSHLPSQGINMFMTQQDIFFPRWLRSLHLCPCGCSFTERLSVRKVKFYGHCTYDIYMDTIYKHINSKMYAYVGQVYAHMSALVEDRMMGVLLYHSSADSWGRVSHWEPGVSWQPASPGYPPACLPPQQWGYRCTATFRLFCIGTRHSNSGAYAWIARILTHQAISLPINIRLFKCIYGLIVSTNPHQGMVQ